MLSSVGRVAVPWEAMNSQPIAMNSAPETSAHTVVVTGPIRRRRGRNHARLPRSRRSHSNASTNNGRAMPTAYMPSTSPP